MSIQLFKKILCPVDINNPPLGTIEFVRQLINTLRPSEIHFLYVCQFVPIMYYPEQFLQPVCDASTVPGGVQAERHLLEEFITSHFASIPNITVHIDTGDIASTILHYAEQSKIDLIVLETHKRENLFDLFSSSIPEKVIRHSQSSVIVLK